MTAPKRDVLELANFPDRSRMIRVPLDLFLIPHRGRPPVSKPQQIVDLALSPALILGRQRIDASIDANVANQELRALDKVRDLIDGSPAETTCASCHCALPCFFSV
jgi:hypothetical protein